MPNVEMICLANGRKLGARCVAGLRLDGLGWLRPVGSDPDGKLYSVDYILDNLTEVRPLDVFRVGLRAPKPGPHQPENWLIDGSIWKLLARPLDVSLVPLLHNALVPGPEVLHGLTDRVVWADLQKHHAPASLALIAPEAVELYPHQTILGKPQARGRFCLGTGSEVYVQDLSVTDPQWEHTVLVHGPRTLKQEDARFLLTISLSEPFGLFCYKIIAAIILLPPSLASLF